MQRRADLAAFARALAVEQRHRNGCKEVHAGHLVALGRQRESRRPALVGQGVEQAGAGEEGGRVEARLVGVRTLLAVAGQRGIDQARVGGLHVGVTHA